MSLLNSDERLAVTAWACPKKGDTGRGILRFDTDPLGDCASSIRSMIADVRVWSTDVPVSGGDSMFVYFEPVEKIPSPESLSQRDSGLQESWGGLELWRESDHAEYAEFIPTHAIKRKAFLAAVEVLKDHLDRRIV